MLDEFTADKSNFSKAIAAMLPPNLINESKPTKRKSTKKKR
jgi:hypothetical protein